MSLTFSSALEAETIRLLEEAIADETRLLSQGHIHNIEDYKHHVGIIRGFERAKDMISDANRYLQTGERDK
jgi:hypothetical protein